jgi:hypothetical protein
MRLPCVRFTLLTLCVICGFHTVWAQAPSDTDATTSELRRGDQAFLARKYPDAIQSYKNANKLDNDSCVLCYLRLSRTYTEMKNWREAGDMADKGLVLATSDPLRAGLTT